MWPAKRSTLWQRFICAARAASVYWIWCGMSIDLNICWLCNIELLRMFQFLVAEHDRKKADPNTKYIKCSPKAACFLHTHCKCLTWHTALWFLKSLHWLGARVTKLNVHLLWTISRRALCYMWVVDGGEVCCKCSRLFKFIGCFGFHIFGNIL